MIFLAVKDASILNSWANTQIIKLKGFLKWSNEKKGKMGKTHGKNVKRSWLDWYMAIEPKGV
jgi:hypothetical protein